VVLHEPVLGGASRAVLGVVPALEQLGWTFSFWVPGAGEARSALEQLGHRVSGASRLLRYRWRTLREPPGAARRAASLPGYLREYLRWVRSEGAGVVHVNTVQALPEAFLARHGGRGAVLLHVHEMLASGPLGHSAGALARISAHEVVAVSRASAARLGQRGVTATVVPNGVELPPDGPAGSGAGPPVVGMLGTVSKRKGSDVFLEAARLVQREEPGVEFRMVGARASGPERPWSDQLLRSARAAGVEHREVTDVFSELAEWDVFALPSREDPFPLAVLEAMAAGLPVVASAVDGIAEQITADTGLLVAPDDPAALAANIVELVRAPARRGALGAAARRRVAREFTLERQAERMQDAYLSAQAARGRA
jgi:glycosyltransferase involved in cell wall biosynthesis